MFVDKKYFGLYLSKKRTQAGLSQGHLAEKLGYSSGQFVSNWERGTSTPPLNKIPALASELNIPIEEMIDFITSETESFLKSELLPRQKRLKGKR